TNVEPGTIRPGRRGSAGLPGKDKVFARDLRPRASSSRPGPPPPAGVRAALTAHHRWTWQGRPGRWDRVTLGVHRLDGEVAEPVPVPPLPSRNTGSRDVRSHHGKTSGAWSSANRLSNCVSSPPGSLLRPSLPEAAVLPVNVLPVTAAVPKLSMPPP